MKLRHPPPIGGDIFGGAPPHNSQYLARLAAEATTLINAPDYAKTDRDLANRRRMIAASEDSIAILKAAPVDMAPAEIEQCSIVLEMQRRRPHEELAEMRLATTEDAR